MQASESMDIVDKLTAIDLKAATSAGDIAEGLAQFANIGSLAGVDMDQAAAYVATIADVTQASGTQVGTSMKTIISRYGNVKAGAYNKMNLASAEEGDAVNDVEKVLNKIGISIRSSSLTFKDFDEVLAEVAEKWDALDNVSKKAIATALAGIRQQESVVTLLSNWTKYEELLEVSRNSRGTAETKYTAYQESYQAAQKRLTAAVENIASNSGVAGLLTEGINLLAEIVDALPKILKWMPGLIAGMSNYRALSGQSWLQKGLKGLEEKGRLRSLRSFFIGDKRRDATDAYVAARGERVFKSAKEFEKAAENTAKSAQETQAAMEETGEQITFDSVLEEQHKENTARLGAQETQEEEKQLALKQQGGEGASGGSLWASKGALLATMAINQTMAGASAYMTGGQTHTDSRGNTVTSSEEAKSVSRSVDAALSAAIPFIGGFLGDLVGNWVARSIDKIRDDIHNLSADAQETTNVLEHISSQVSEIKSLSTLKSIDDIRRADALADEFLSDIYKSENDSTRKVFKEELGKINNGDDDLYKLVQSFKNEVGEGRREAARKLEIAQVKALHQQEKIARTEDIYNQEQKVGNAQLKYNSALDGFTDLGITNRESAMAWGGGTAAGIGTAGALATTGAILLAAWPGLLGKLIGGALLGGSLVAGFGAGSAVGSAITNNYKQQRAQEWERSLVSDKLTILSEQAELMKRIIETGNDQAREDAQQQLAATEEMARALKDYQQYMWTLRDEDNKMLVEEALLTAQTMSAGRNAYLTDLNVVELKRLGVGKIYRTLAEEVEKSGGLAGYSMRYENGDLSEGFLKYAERVLKTDEEIAAVLSGEAYKLKEALEKLNPKDQFDKKILESFASAIGTTVSNLPQFIDKLGELTLADLLKSTQELIDSTSAFSSLLNTMASSTESISGWMNKIVQQYPDLIAYMSDTPRVMQEIMTQLRQLNNQELKEQWNQYAASGDHYDKVFKPGIFSYVASLRKMQKTELTDADIDNALQQSGATTMASLLKYLMGTDTSKEINKVLIEAFQHASGDTLVADLYREQLKNATEFIASAYQKQVDALTEQRNMLENINKQREYELKLLKARVRLEEAMNDKRRIYRAGVGWVYEADQNKIAEAQKEIEDLSVEKQISKIDKQISAIAYIADKWKTLWDVRTEEQKQELTEVFFGEFSSNGRGAVQAIVEGFSEDFNNTLTDGGGTAASLLSQAVFLLDGIEVGVDKISEQVVEASLEDREQTLADLTNAWKDYTKLLGKNKTASELNSALEKYQRIYSIAESKGYIGSDFHQSAGTGVNSLEALKAATQDMYTPKYSYSVNTPSGSQSYVTDYSSAQKSIVSEILDPDKNIRFMQDPRNKKSGNWSDAKAGTWGGSFAQFISKAYGEDIGLYESAEDLAAFLQERGVEDLLFQHGDGRSALYHDGAFYALSKSSEGSSQSSVVWGNEMGINTIFSSPSPFWGKPEVPLVRNALGTTNFAGATALLNEFGTEAIITPSGTLTALPAHSGILPADITSNLWALGEIAPNLLRAVEGGISLRNGVSGSAPLCDESFNINNLTMNVSADSSFDADAFVKSIKARVALTKNLT